jgi:cytidine deaminase
MRYETLISMAIQAREHSYSPYSEFRVGAALLSESGKVYCGCNVENAAFSPGICAERTAFARAVSEGERSFRAIAIVGGKTGGALEHTPPCGVCRQVMMEFCDPSVFEIITGTGDEDYQVYKLEELLPLGFGPGNLGRRKDL